MPSPRAAPAALAILLAAAARAQAPEAMPPAGAGEAPDGGAAAPPASSLPFHAGSVRAVVLEHQAEVQRCYEEVLAGGRDAQGEVLVSFVVTPRGTAERARVERSTLRAPAVEACVLQAVRRWTFPRPRRRQRVEFPFRFDEVGGQPRQPGKPARPGPGG